jgi:hypothetical protein
MTHSLNESERGDGTYDDDIFVSPQLGVTAPLEGKDQTCNGPSDKNCSQEIKAEGLLEDFSR